MQYALLIYSDPNHVNTEEEMAAYFAFTAEARQAGAYKGGEALHPLNTATSVRTQDGAKGMVTDGPFAETKEFLGGFFLMECKDLDEAIMWAKKINAIDNSTIEIRPIWEFDKGD